MRIKLLVGLAHPDNARDAGDVVDVDQAEAVRHIEAGHAIPVAERSIETPEKPRAAVERRAPTKRRKKKK
jgi:hypothetical protein